MELNIWKGITLLSLVFGVYSLLPIISGLTEAGRITSWIFLSTSLILITVFLLAERTDRKINELQKGLYRTRRGVRP